MNRDERAAKHNDLYVGIGHKSRLCHEDWMTKDENNGEDILFFSQEQLLSLWPKRFVGRYSGKYLRPISDEDRQKILDRLSFLKIKDLNEAVSISHSIPMRYTAQEYEALGNTKEDSKHPLLQTALNLNMERPMFIIMILMALVLSLLLFDIRSENAVLVDGKPFRSNLFYLWAFPLSILNGFLSMHDRRIVRAMTLGWFPASLRVIGLLLSSYPLLSGIRFAVLILLALFVFAKEYFRFSCTWYSVERARNVVAMIVCAECFLVILLDTVVPICSQLLM